MPDLDLPPSKYRKQNRWGQWYEPDDWRVLAILLVLDIAALCLVFWRRAELLDNLGVLFAVTAGFSAAAGGLIILLLKHFDLN